MTTIETPANARCASCGYLLRGLPSEGKCPECAWPVEASRSSTIAHASPAEWRRLMWGLWASALAMLLSPACIVGCFLLITRDDAGSRQMYGLLLAVMFVATLLAHAWAAWALGTFVQRRLPHIRIPPSWPEVYAGGGLLLLALSSLLFGSVGFEAYVLFPSGLGFAAIAAGTFRLPAFYRMLGSLGLATDWTSASWGISESTPGTGYGQVKFVVEGGLCLCVTLMHLAWFIGAAALVAGMAALLLLTLYPCIWLPTMFFHLALAVQVAKRTRQVTRAAAV